MNYLLLLIPLFSAITGWLTIRLSIWFLFHPYRPRVFAGIALQGLFPRYRERLAGGIATLVATELSSSGSMEQEINNPSNFEKIRPLIETHMDDFLRNRLKDQMPMIGMFIGDKTIVTLKAIFIQEIETLFPRVMSGFVSNSDTQSNVEEMVKRKIDGISPVRLEEIFYQLMGGPFRLACLLGGMIGLILGVLQLLLVLVIA